MLSAQGNQFVQRAVFHVVQHLAELAAQEGGDDGGRRFVGAQAVGIGGAHDGGLQQAVVAVDGHQRVDHEGDEAQVLLGRLAGGHEQDAGVGAQRPVVVLARAVDALERLFVEQDAEAVRAGYFAHEGHDEHVVVHRQVALLEDGRQLKLVGRHLVVAGLQGDAQFQGLYLEVFHEGGHAGGDGAEVVVFELLVLRGLVPPSACGR